MEFIYPALSAESAVHINRRTAIRVNDRRLDLNYLIISRRQREAGLARRRGEGDNREGGARVMVRAERVVMVRELHC